MHILFDVLQLGELIVGAKAFRLAKMQSIGLRVKPGIVLDAQEVLDICTAGKVPRSIIDAAYNHVDFRGGIAVRSSAVGEDGDFSWAGQFISRLFVAEDELAATILECARALNSDAVKTYAALHGIDAGHLALILQEMVPATVAGVMFTRHPVTFDDNSMVIEVIAGVAEDLVSGRTEPKRYYVDAASGAVMNEEGALQPALTREQLVELVSIGRMLRDYFGKGQDVEWAIEKGTGLIYVNQSRNITTDGKKSLVQGVVTTVGHELQEEDVRLAGLGCELLPDVLSDQNISEILTPHPYQMSFGLFAYCFAHGQGAIRIARNAMGYDIGDELNSGFFRLVAGQPRCSIIHDAFTYRIHGIPLDDYCKLVDYYVRRIHENPSLGNYPEVQLYEQDPRQEFLVQIFGREKARTYAVAYQRFFDRIRVLEDSLDQECRVALTSWNEHMVRLAHERVDTPEALQQRYLEVCELLRTQACPLFVKVARLGFFSYTRLRNLLHELFGVDGEGYLNTLTGGVSSDDNPNLQFNTDLRLFRQGGLHQDVILARYGHLASHELEISTPRYHEQPKFLSELAEKLCLSEPEDPHEAQHKAEALLSHLAHQAGSNGDQLRREVGIVRTYLPLREVVKFHFLKGYALLRQYVVQLEKQLQWPSGLMFHLNPEEVFRLCENESAMRLIAIERGKCKKREGSIDVPPVVFTDQLSTIGGYTPENSNMLRGIGVTNAIAEGEVVVIRNLAESDAIAQLCPGKILVTITTDPAWSPVLAILGADGGLITEVGGLLAHGAIYAREMGIAAVLNVAHATQILNTGMRVRVNGPAGIVEILA